MGARWVMGAGGRGGGGSDGGGGAWRRSTTDRRPPTRRRRRPRPRRAVAEADGHERAAAHRDGHGRGHRVGHARHGRWCSSACRRRRPPPRTRSSRPTRRRHSCSTPSSSAGSSRRTSRRRTSSCTRSTAPTASTITGYQAGNTVSATIRDVTKAGTIIDAAAGVVGDQITLQGVSFTIDDTGSLRQAARDDAVAHAKSQADQLAAATGLKVGKVVSIVRGRGPEHPARVRRGGCCGHHGGRLDAGPAPAGAAGAEPVRHGRLRAHVVSGRTDRTALLP